MIRLAKASIGLSIFALAAVTMFAPACGNDDCASSCTRAQQCGALKGVDCDQYCDETEGAASNAGCSSEYSDYVSCEAGLTDICTGQAQCGSQLATVTKCAAPYCLKHLTESGCADVGL
jgi:hypothetical protein